jgi:rhodanese-related sulfurtransferase
VQKFVPALVVAVVALSSSVALACGGNKGQSAQNGASFPQVVASQTDKAAPAQKSDTTTPSTSVAAPAAEKSAEKSAEKTFKMVSVDDVQKGIDAAKATKKPFAVFDANGKSTRDTKGIIPTAVLLPSSSGYDLALLPKDKATPTVFYCANERCSASHSAAKRAIEAGYTDVAVLPDGILGWIKAGKATEKAPVG